jgi:hypothetical protein
VCKQISNQAKPMFFAGNRFVFKIPPNAGSLPSGVQHFPSAEEEALRLMRTFDIHFVLPLKGRDGCSCVGDAFGRFEYSKKDNSFRGKVTSHNRSRKSCTGNGECRYARAERQCREIYNLLWEIVKDNNPHASNIGLHWVPASVRDCMVVVQSCDL